VDIRERNRLSNVYRREASQVGIASPYRQSVYITARLRGLSPQKAVEKAKKGRV
jgi:hypothetical protein